MVTESAAIHSNRFRKHAVVKPQTTDRCLRTVARVECDGVCGGVDANAEQVCAGMACMFHRYVTDRSLYAVQDEARAARLEPSSAISE